VVAHFPKTPQLIHRPAIMNSSQTEPHRSTHHQTEVGDRLSLRMKLGYSTVGMSYTLMENAIANMANAVLNIGLGMNPFLVGPASGCLPQTPASCRQLDHARCGLAILKSTRKGLFFA
jgi:hypothetical protein